MRWLLAFLFVPFFCMAQVKKIDSLKMAVEKTGHDTSRVMALIRLSTAYNTAGEYEKSQAAVNEAKKLSSPKGYEYYMAKSLNASASLFMYKEEYDSSLKQNQASLRMWEALLQTDSSE